MASMLHSLRRWTEGLRHPAHDHDRDARECQRALEWLADEVETGLRDIEFREVTVQDRITFIESLVTWQVRQALKVGRFDLAVRMQRYGVDRIAELHEQAQGWRPVLLYGTRPSARTERGSAD